MTLRAVFAYNNLDDTADLNAHFKALVKRGVISGGQILPVAATSNVTVNPFYAASADGMIIFGDTASTVSCVPGQVNFVVLRAVYNSPAAPTLSFECMSQSNYNADPQKNYLILFGTVDLTLSTSVSLSAISYATRDRIDQVGHSRFLGSYSSIQERDTIWPSTVPTAQQPNDFVIVINAVSGQPSFYYWSGTIWAPFGNYEQLSSAFEAHTAGVVGDGASVHVTANEKAAMVGTGGIPGATNRFVTEGDVTRVLDVDQMAAINGALAGGPLSATNPLIGDGIPVAVTRLVAYTPSVAQDFVNVARGSNGVGLPAFMSPVYVGKLGIDTISSTSSARRCFKIEDAFFNGYSDNEGPLYVVDIQDASGGSSYNPASDSANVSSIGYWDPSNPASALRIKFNRVLAAGRTIYIKFNARGSISTLAPGGAYLPATTGFSAGRDAYQDVFVSVVNLQTVQTSNIHQLYLDSGSTETPSLAFSADHGTGLFYAGTFADSHVSTYSAMGISVNSETVALFSRNVSASSLDLPPLESPLVFEQSFDDTAVGYRIYQICGRHTDASGIDIGWSDYNSGFTSSVNVNRTTGVTFFAKTTYNAQLVTSAGTELAPGLGIGNTRSGFYYLGTYVSDQTSFNNFIGLSMNGHAAFGFATNTPSNSITTGLQGALVFEQSVVGTQITYRRTINAKNSDPSALSHSFGVSTYASDYKEWASISDAGISTSTVTATEFGFANGVAFRQSGAGWSIGASIGTTVNGITINSDTTVTGSVTASGVLVDSGTELAPSIAFSARPNTGFYYAGTVGALGTTQIKYAVGVSIDGMSVLLIGRASNGTHLSSNEAPLMIEQDLVSSSSSTVKFIGFNRTSTDPRTDALQFGFGDYNADFIPVFEVLPNGAAPQPFHVMAKSLFDSDMLVSGKIMSTSSVTATSVRSNTFVATADSDATAPAFLVGANDGLYGSNSLVGIALNGAAFLTCQTTAGGTLSIVSNHFNVTSPAMLIGAGTALTIHGSVVSDGDFTVHNLGSDGTIFANNLSVTGTFTLAGTLTVTTIEAVTVTASGTITANALNANSGLFTGIVFAALGNMSSVVTTSLTTGVIIYRQSQDASAPIAKSFDATSANNGGNPVTTKTFKLTHGFPATSVEKLDAGVCYHARRIIIDSNLYGAGHHLEYTLEINSDEIITIGTSYKILFIVGDSNQDLLHQALVSGGAAGTTTTMMDLAGGLMTNPPPSGTELALQDSQDSVLIIKDVMSAGDQEIGRFRFIDPLARTYGYYDDAYGFELTLVRVTDLTGFNSYPADELNWVAYINRLGKQ